MRVISEAKAESIRNAFSKYKCRKLIVFSFKSNYQNRINELPKKADILTINFQVQPFFNFFIKKAEECGMKPNDSESFKLEKDIIEEYLRNKGLI